MKTIRRRRREAKTDYKSRLALLKSGKARLVIRKSNKYITAQIVETDIAQDKTIAKASSKDLLEKGWPSEKLGSLKSLQAAYLTGFLLGKKLKGKMENVILDIGLNRNVSGSRIFSLVKGAADAGIDVTFNKKIAPSDERLKSNENTSTLIEKIKENL